MLTVSELFAHADFYAHHPQIKEFASTSGYSNAAIITIFLSEQKAINTFNGDFSKLVSAIQALAQQTAEPTVYSRQFHILALASVIERPIYAVYPDIPSAWAVKLACHGYFYPRKVFQSESNLETIKDDAIFVMWTRTDRMPLLGWVPNHFVLLQEASAIPSSTSYASVLAGNKPNQIRTSADIRTPTKQATWGTKRGTSNTHTWQKSTSSTHPQKQTPSCNSQQKSTDSVPPHKNIHPTANQLGRNQLILYHPRNN